MKGSIDIENPTQHNENVQKSILQLMNILVINHDSEAYEDLNKAMMYLDKACWGLKERDTINDGEVESCESI